ncbi:MAG: 2-oxo acid dehydrogenase subunit E2 [Legionella sp.]|nr:2-oxo acid dehydrogenase subunit E2 [Legionella sp.]
MIELNSLLKPCWGSEKWILEGWNKITEDEQEDIKARVDSLFKDGLPFEIKHDKLLYIYAFSLMAQLEVLGIQLPMQFEDKMQNPEFKKRMRAQLVDEIFHAIAFTKIVFLLCAPYDSPPAYNERLEHICNFIRSQDCIKVGMVVMNLICEGLVEEVFTIFHKYDIAPELFEIIIEDEHRHVCEADLYAEIGLPDQEVLVKKLKELEELILSAFTLEPKYTIALNALIGPEGIAEFMLALHEKQSRQLKKIGITPSDKWELFFKIGPDTYEELKAYPKKLKQEFDNEVYEVEMPPTKKVLMTQMNSPGDPTMVAQFNIDVSNFGFFENKYPHETLTALMMQAISSVLMSHDSFRNFLSFNKLYQTRSAYVSVIEKLPDCDAHLSTIHFHNCHEMTTNQLLSKINRSLQMMTYCYNKCAQIEEEHPDVKQQLDDMLYSHAHDVYPCPAPGSHSVFLSNIGSYGYSQASSPLLTHTGLHILLLAVERKSVWNNTTKSFEIKDLLPVSISADSRIFDGLLPIPDLLNKAFQTALQKMDQEDADPTAKELTELSSYQQKIEQLADDLLVKFESPVRQKIIKHLVQNALSKEKKGLLDEELDLLKLNEYSDFKSIADNILLDYLKFNSEEAEKSEHFEKFVDRLLTENLELGYRWLFNLQNAWIDYIDVEALFASIFKKTAHSRLNKLAHLIPNILSRPKVT